jgi:predicted phage baseplate assembly protein
MVHARVVHDENIGVSDGTPGQRFPLQHRPVLPWANSSLNVTAGGETSEWRAVENFAGEDKASRCFHIDPVAGEVVFGPAVREADGRVRQYGSVPTKSATLRMVAYQTGGGATGNVSKGQIRVLKTSVPYVARVENRGAAVGGAEQETIEELKARGPLIIRSRGRAVTAEDFEQMTREAAPEIARAHCLTATHESQAGLVRVLVVPNVGEDPLHSVRLEDLELRDETRTKIEAYLDARRLVGTRVNVEKPAYQGLTVAVKLTALPGFDRNLLRNDVRRALNRLFHPLKGGPDGRGWPVGRAVAPHEVAAVLAWIAGVNMSEELRLELFPADPRTGRRQREPVDRFPLPRNGLVFSYNHSVRVE